MKYYIWSYEHDMWWKHAERGYTSDISCAGIYDEKEAQQIQLKANKFSNKVNEVIISEHLAGEISREHNMNKQQIRANSVVRNKKTGATGIIDPSGLLLGIPTSRHNVPVKYMSEHRKWEDINDLELLHNTESTPKKSKEKEWPQEDDTIWTINHDEETGEPYASDFQIYGEEQIPKNTDECYRTKQYAEWIIKHKAALDRLRKIAERDYEANKIDWNEDTIDKHSIRRRHIGIEGKWIIETQMSSRQAPGAVYFHKEPDLDHIKKEMGKLMDALLWKPETHD